jgi:hypothetical protein
MSRRIVLEVSLLTIFAIFVVSVVFGLFFISPTHAVNWNTYYNQEYGFGIDYPDNSTGKLTLTPTSNSNKSTIEFPNSGFEANMTVTNKTSNNLNHFVLKDFNDRVELYGNQSIVQGISNLTNGALTYSQLIPGKEAGNDILIKKTFLEHGDKIFTFWFRDDSRAFDNQTYNTMSNSIIFLD